MLMLLKEILSVIQTFLCHTYRKQKICPYPQNGMNLNIAQSKAYLSIPESNNHFCELETVKISKPYIDMTPLIRVYCHRLINVVCEILRDVGL